MIETVAIGKQDFGEIRKNNCFYIDKTSFIKEWWENRDDVTLINRPRRFGKTLNMSMVDYFFSVNHKECGDIFVGLDIWKEESYRQLQGTYPLIFLSFAKIKDNDFQSMVYSISKVIFDEYSKYRYLLDGNSMSDNEKEFYNLIKPDMPVKLMGDAINSLSNFLSRYYGKKVIILLDEYDTPMQEAYVNGYWNEASNFFRILFNATFKTNPYMERALITGITRISKESMFSDMNNPEVITTTSMKYSTSFGFTEDEVFTAMDKYGLESKSEMKQWYDGYAFGDTKDIYNPWSVINVLDKRKYESYWANTSSNTLLNSIIRRGDANLKMQMEELLSGNSIVCNIDEEIVYNQLDSKKDAVWSLMLATGYLKVEKFEHVGRFNKRQYTLKLPNMEIESMLNDMVAGWFDNDSSKYNDFVKALLVNDVEAMNEFMNDIALNCFSNFDIPKNASGKDAPERFYHGFVLGLMVGLSDRYEIKSNRESGFGRYDVMLRPFDIEKDNAYIIEFKVFKPTKEKNLEETLQNALAQINEKHYEQELLAAGIPEKNIRKYGFAFEGKKVLIG